MGAYEFYIGKQVLPVAPEKMEVKINSHNKSLTLSEGTEINIIKSPGLAEITFEFRLPIQKYPWSNYGGATDQVRILNMLEEVKQKRSIFEFTVLRNRSDYTSHKSAIFSTNMKVTLEDYTIKEDVEYGGDVLVEVNLKQFKPFYITISSDGKKQYVGNTNNPSSLVKVATIKGDTVATIAARYYDTETLDAGRVARQIITYNTQTLQKYGIRLYGTYINGLNAPLPSGVELMLPVV